MTCHHDVEKLLGLKSDAYVIGSIDTVPIHVGAVAFAWNLSQFGKLIMYLAISGRETTIENCRWKTIGVP